MLQQIIWAIVMAYGICFVTAFLMGLFEQSDTVRNSYSGSGTNNEGALLLLIESIRPWHAIPATAKHRRERIKRERP